MKRHIRSLIIICAMAHSVFTFAQSNSIRLNQLGYYPDANKYAVVVFTPATTFEVINLADTSVEYAGNLSEQAYWKDATDSVKKADFSAVTKAGKYKIRIPGFGESYPFEISKTVLRKAAYASLKSFYYQRSSYKLESPYAGLWARAAGHPDTAVVLHSSTGKSGKISSPGGWYDAGDYGKYVINAGISVASMLSFYENFPHFFADSSILIPESGNGKNDLLDEVKFELDWLKTMQDTSDGGVFFKLTTLAFSGFVMPDGDKATRYAIGKTSASALDFAAMMAMAGRIYGDYDSAWAADCIIRAKDAWTWAKAHPAVYFNNPADVSTGEYGDGNVSDEFLWAAAELYITTGEDEYKTYLESRSSSLNYYNAPGWPAVQPLASLSLLTRPNGISASILNNIRNSLLSTCDNWLGQIDSNPCRIPQFGFNWGSNSGIANIGVGLLYAWIVSQDSKYIKGAAECADYLLGKNGTGFSFVSGYGSRAPMNFHHRPSASDGITQPVPGFISGGPNSGKEDGESYPFSAPAKCFVDVTGSYASNEVCINWNSPLTALLAGVDAVLGDSSVVDFPVATSANNPPSLSISAPLSNGRVGNDAPMTIKGNATDPDGIEKVEFYINSHYIGQTTGGAYQYTLDTLVPGNHTITVLALDSKGLAMEKTNLFRYYMVNYAPGLIEAENYSNMSGISTQKTTDGGGGYNVNSLDLNDWLDYSVVVSDAGDYRIDYRVAAISGGKFELKSLTQSVYSTMAFNGTGGSQKWITISDTITLKAGKQTIRVNSLKAGWNFNWMSLEPVVETGIADQTGKAAVFVQVLPNPVSDDFSLQYSLTENTAAEFRIYSLDGRLAGEQRIDEAEGLTGSSQWINPPLNAGVYIVHLLQNGKQVATCRLVKVN
ncbi:MAG: glycoside hydrolase family 9 protein [Bacteroidales bacterium]